MINETVSFFEKCAKDIGLTIKIPRPSRATKITCATINGVAGTSLVVAGIAVSSKTLIVFGTLGLASATALALDK